MLNKNNIKISLIVPCYNIRKYLPRCIESILAQTYKNLEIILISDGSTDGTDEVIREYAKKDSRIIPIFKQNSGVSDTRNRGLDIATGDYIGFVDGDDYIEPEMYETLLKNAIENNADISHCGYQMVFPSRVDYYYNTGKKVIQDNKKGIRDIIVGDYVEPSPCIKIYRKNIVNNLRMPINIKINEDVLFNFYAFVNSKKSVYEDLPFYHYILRKGSAATSKINQNKLFDPVRVRKEIFEYSLKNLDNEIQSVAYSSYLNSIINLYRVVSNSKLKEYKEESFILKGQIKEIKGKFMLSKRIKTERFLFFHCTGLLMFTYKIYDKLLSKNTNKYEVK
ncbi:glycosyltransferase family 2 protein [Ruminococcus bromii]|jgi:glycosyltransferase involved in cell wall biosynthesis|uniref:glycosyltransferase family 2 protein n=1 Tax=Ruminococcus bromii TaxID=40518 RepID=UPI0026EFA3E8|nr:glycosyltransferase [Ruminococcus bromii]